MFSVLFLEFDCLLALGILLGFPISALEFLDFQSACGLEMSFQAVKSPSESKGNGISNLKFTVCNDSSHQIPLVMFFDFLFASHLLQGIVCVYRREGGVLTFQSFSTPARRFLRSTLSYSNGDSGEIVVSQPRCQDHITFKFFNI